MTIVVFSSTILLLQRISLLALQLPILICCRLLSSNSLRTFSKSQHGRARRYDYVMTADDDTYVRLGPLAWSLNPLPRRDLYYSFVLPCASTDAHGGYMSGMGFVLSWDLVEWIAGSKAAAQDTVGPEDQLVGRLLAGGGKVRNRRTEKPGMYDYPGTNGRCSHDLIPATVAVHRLKRWDRWLHVIDFFNIAKRLKPSKLYFID